MEKIFNKTLDRASQKGVASFKEMLKKEVVAASLIHGVDKFLHGGLKGTLAQHMSMETNQYPQSLEETMNILIIYKKTTRMQQHSKTNKKKKDNQTEVFFVKMQKEGNQI